MNDNIHILFRIPFTRYFLAYVNKGGYRWSYFGIYKKQFNGEYYWEEV